MNKDEIIIKTCPHVSYTDYGVCACRLYKPMDKNSFVKFGTCGANSTCPYKIAELKTQECEKLSILAQEESARNAYIEYELNDKLKQKTQEYENLKSEERYLKQCCEKAGGELAKHSFDYDGKEKNLVVQAMELNEKYEKLEKALEDIEGIIKQTKQRVFCQHCAWYNTDGCDPSDKTCGDFIKILDIINKAKGERNE